MDDIQAPIIIALMGVTGSGKSTFIRSLTQNNNINIGTSLRSCTRTFQAATMHIGSRRVILIDTPGFNDTFQSDSEILVELSFWLKQMNLMLSGLIYLHPITQRRIHSSTVWNREIMKTLMGVVNLDKVVLVTNRWEELKSEQQGTEIESKLLGPGGFWYNIQAQQNHPRHFRHEGTIESGLSIMNRIVNQAQACVIRFQVEVVLENKDIIQTGAGQVLIERVAGFGGDLYAQNAELQAQTRAQDARRYLLLRQAIRKELLEKHQIQSQDPEPESGLSRLCVIQ